MGSIEEQELEDSIELLNTEISDLEDENEELLIKLDDLENTMENIREYIISISDGEEVFNISKMLELLN